MRRAGGPPPELDATLLQGIARTLCEQVNTLLASRPNLHVIWRSMPPRHFTNGDWNTGGKCGARALPGESTRDPTLAASLELARNHTRYTRELLLLTSYFLLVDF